MNKLTKGAIAAAAGVILLMGGAGTLASWNSSASAGTAQTITAGQLNLTTPVNGAWKNAQGTTLTSSYKVVPGDVLSYVQTYTIAASGDNLYFTVAPTAGAFGSTTAGTPSAALASQLSQGATFAVSGTGVALTGTTPGVYKVASTSSSSTITVTMTVTFLNGPATSGATVDNSAMLGSVTLGAGAITLTQVASA